MEHVIRHVRGHVEVFDQSGRFILSADSEHEALHEIGLYLKEQYRQNRVI